jgi:hypothetical protein
VPADRGAARRDTEALFAARAAALPEAGAPRDAQAPVDAGPRPLPEGHPNPALAANEKTVLPLREGLIALGKTSPAGYPYWEPMALDGAEAARRGDLAGVRASCIACHERHAEHWRREHPWPTPATDAH